MLTLPARQLVPHREPGGDLEIIWGWQERTFSRSFCGIGQHNHSTVAIQEPQPAYPAALCEAFSLPLHRARDPFPQGRERTPDPDPWCLIIKARQKGVSTVAFSHCRLLDGHPRLTLWVCACSVWVSLIGIGKPSTRTRA